METNYCKEICDDCTQECMKNKIYQEAKEIWSKQEKDLIDQIISLNNQIADLKEKLYCSNCGWDNKYPKLKKAKLCLAYDDRDNCEDFKKVSNACISCNMYNNPEHQ